jgi:ArsR family transcriptional regulator
MTKKQDLCCDDNNELNQNSNCSDEELLSIYTKALSHPARIKILNFLKKKKTCICGDIVNELPLAQATVSQHLKVLKNAGFIKGEISGPSICYCINPDTIKKFKKLIAQF